MVAKEIVCTTRFIQRRNSSISLLKASLFRSYALENLQPGQPGVSNGVEILLTGSGNTYVWRADHLPELDIDSHHMSTHWLAI